MLNVKTPFPHVVSTHSIIKQTVTLAMLLVGFIFLLTIFFLIQTEHELNQTHHQHSALLLKKALENREDSLKLHLADNADWNEAYENLGREINVHWAWDEQNLGKSLYRNFGYDGVFVLTSEAVTRYSVIEGELKLLPIDKWLGQNVIQQIRSDLMSKEANVVSAWINMQGQPALLAAAWITPENDDTPTQQQADRSILVFVDKLTPAKLLLLGDEYGLPDLQTARAPEADKTANKEGVLLPAEGGLIYLQWSERNSSAVLFNWVIPLLILLMLMSVLFALSLARKAFLKARMNDEKNLLIEQNRQALMVSEHRFRDVVETTTDWIWEADEYRRLTWLSARFPIITGQRIEEWIGRQFDDFLLEDNAAFTAWLNTPYQEKVLILSNCRYLSRSRDPRYCNITLKRVRTQDGGQGFRGTARDVTQEVEASELIHYLSYHDELTGLPNRLKLREFLEEKLQQSQHNGKMLAMLSLDLNDFKTINDVYGHAAGDDALRKVATRLRQCIRSDDMAARQGGDEFIIIIPDVTDNDEIHRICQRIIADICTPFDVFGFNVTLGINIGIATFPCDAQSVSGLLKSADMALYKAKSMGTRNYVFYLPEMEKNAAQRRELENDLREALDSEQLFLLYQPRYNLNSSTITSVEALVRWNHPKYGLLMPDSFIALAEETGLIIPLTDWVLTTACHDVGARFDDISVSVNISPTEFKASDIVSRVKKALLDASFPASRLELEVTENVTLCKPEQALATMSGLKSLGVKLLIDDFGTGYASLYYLHSFPFDGIKIDKSFIFDMNTSAAALRIIERIVGLGKDYNLEVTAEGVETNEQLTLLKHFNCDIAQGYYINRPVPLSEITLNANYLTENNMSTGK